MIEDQSKQSQTSMPQTTNVWKSYLTLIKLERLSFFIFQSNILRIK